MLLYAFLFVVGLVILYFGAEGLVQGASSVALQYGIPPVVVGLTVVALGTSMPEFLVNVFALLTDESPLALGNIIGSNISNVALILGSCALVLPLTVTPAILRREYPVMLGVMVLFYVCALDGVIGTIDGIVMITLLLGLGGILFYDTQQSESAAILEQMEGDLEADPQMSALAEVGYVLGGMIGLALGAHLMVDSAVAMAHRLGIATGIIGLTAVALGTSLPELAASMVSVAKSDVDMSVGNVMGSNVLNVLFVVGFLSIFHSLEVETRSLQFDFPVMLGFCGLLLPLAWTNSRISRLGGSILLVAFLGYLGYLMLPYL
ncbi:MAG: sodium:proton exchanger [Bacteroidetes bacterium SW_9_63_38]|nr:MAG: sodium:proton exchanger [Bacteroidetes bacterium SW_9_63_38]